MERQTWTTCQGHDGSGLGENMAVVAEGDLNGCTEAFYRSALKQALRANYVKFHIDKTSESPICRMCG